MHRIATFLATVAYKLEMTLLKFDLSLQSGCDSTMFWKAKLTSQTKRSRRVVPDDCAAVGIVEVVQIASFDRGSSRLVF
jgi:hypothetical protein